MENDELKIPKWITKVLSEVGGKLLKKKSGYAINVQIEDITVTQDDDKAHMDLNVSVDISMEELMKILKAYDLV